MIVSKLIAELLRAPDQSIDVIYESDAKKLTPVRSLTYDSTLNVIIISDELGEI